MNIKPYVCKCCGGPINVAKMRCEYCDIAYEDDSLKRIKIEVDRPGVHTISAQIEVSRKDMTYNPEGVRDFTLRELRNQLADGLLGFMKIETADNYDFRNRTQIIRGTVKVVDPVFSGY